MNDADKRLDELLKGVRMPERSPGYWETFPKRVTAQLPDQSLRSGIGDPTRIWWAVGLTGICCLIVLGAVLWFRPRRPAEPNYAKLYREIEAMFPNQIRAITVDQQGVRLSLSDKPNVPTTSPLRVNVCRQQQCRTFITFSGQQIRVNGEILDVLADGEGDVFIVGQRSVWSSKEPTRQVGAYRIDAQTLRLTS
jgi:hypothetical protein